MLLGKYQSRHIAGFFAGALIALEGFARRFVFDFRKLIKHFGAALLGGRRERGVERNQTAAQPA
jgi:hypothetical protein